MLRKQYRDVSNEWKVANHTSNDVLALQVILTPCIQVGIVGVIVVALGQKLRFVPADQVSISDASGATVAQRQIPLPGSKFANYSVNDWYVLALDIVNDNFTNRRFLHHIAVPE